MKTLCIISTMMVFLMCMVLPAFAQNKSCWEQKSPGAICKEELTGMEFIWIPGGSFKMGSELLEHRSDENPAHMVELDGFWMGKTEVTNAQYRHWKPEHDSKEYEGYSLNGDTQPAVYVSSEDAGAFAEWLTKQHNGRYTFSLPSEAQWEYTARAGTTTSRFWGDDPDDACQYANVHDRTSEKEFDWGNVAHDCDDGYAVTAPVGMFKPNAFGLYDMLGNVKEWCADWYDRYAYRSDSHKKRNPLKSDGGALRVLRGGMWDRSSPGFVRSAIRHRSGPDDRIYNIGFRLIMTTDGEDSMTVEELNEELGKAAKEGDVEKVKTLIASGAEVDSRAFNRQHTPLMLAAYLGHYEVVKILIEAGADVNAAHSPNRTVLYHALESRRLRPELVQLLLDVGADVNAGDQSSFTPLVYAACRGGSNDLLDILLRSGAEIDAAVGEPGITALICAVKKEDIETVKILIEAGADLELADTSGNTPLMIAKSNGSEEIVKLLTDAGATQ